MEKKVVIKNRKGLSLSIKLNISEERKKLIFLEHGMAARKEYPHMKVMEDVFASNGYNVVNIDASDSLNESERSKEGVTFTGYLEDLEDVIKWSETQEFYTEPFAVGGQSLGAEAIVLYSAKCPNKVNLVVSAAFPWLDGKIEVQNNRRTKDILEKGFFDQVSKSTGRTLRINKNYLDDLEQYNLTNIIPKITADTYLIVGTKDTEYHIENNKTLYNLLKCKKELIILPDVPHDLANTTENKAIFTKALQNIVK